jgi:hypothetical protein
MPKFVTEREREQLAEIDLKRNQWIARLGIATREFEQLKRDIIADVDRSERSQAEIGERILRNNGIPETVQATINLATGEILIMEGGTLSPVPDRPPNLKAV